MYLSRSTRSTIGVFVFSKYRYHIRTIHVGFQGATIGTCRRLGTYMMVNTLSCDTFVVNTDAYAKEGDELTLGQLASHNSSNPSHLINTRSAAM